MINNKSYQGIRRINRTEEMNNYQFFWFLSNKLGFKDLEICHNYYINGTKMFSKWQKFLDLLQYDSNEYIPHLYMTRDEFIEKATHRSVLDIELMIDIDEPGDQKNIKDKAKVICKYLIKNNIAFTCCFSGSKSYHISILVPELRNKNKAFITNYKIEILGKFVSSDSQKASIRNMIALEGVNHWKTGRMKKEVLSNE